MSEYDRGRSDGEAGCWVVASVLTAGIGFASGVWPIGVGGVLLLLFLSWWKSIGEQAEERRRREPPPDPNYDPSIWNEIK